jgi:geranylgeranyl pyrophosphate synthase
LIAAAMKEVSKSEPASLQSELPPAPPQIEAVAGLVKQYHGVADTLRRADESVNRAIDAIAAFPDSPAKQALVATAVFAVSRDH